LVFFKEKKYKRKPFFPLFLKRKMEEPNMSGFMDMLVSMSGPGNCLAVSVAHSLLFMNRNRYPKTFVSCEFESVGGPLGTYGSYVRLREPDTSKWYLGAHSLNVALIVHMVFCGPRKEVVVVDAGDAMRLSRNNYYSRAPQVFLLNLDTDSVVGVLMSRGAYAASPRCAACSKDGDRIFVSTLNYVAIAVHVFDRATCSALRVIDVGTLDMEMLLSSAGPPSKRDSFVDMCWDLATLAVACPVATDKQWRIAFPHGFDGEVVVTHEVVGTPVSNIAYSSELTACCDFGRKLVRVTAGRRRFGDCHQWHSVSLPAFSVPFEDGQCTSLTSMRSLHLFGFCAIMRLPDGLVYSVLFQPPWETMSNLRVAWMATCFLAATR
jgi:hypothetical protein